MITRGSMMKAKVPLMVGVLTLAGLIVPTGERGLLNGALPTGVGILNAWEDPAVEAPEFWIFGVQAQPDRAVPLGGQGIRGILDLRTLSAAAAIAMLESYAANDQGITVTLRWKVQNDDGGRLVGKDNYDVPPTPAEAGKALWTLEQILTSDAAKALEGRFNIQLYNEVGGGPGKFSRDELAEMLDFASEAAALIREKAPFVKICGPAITMGQVQARHLSNTRRYRKQAEIIQACLEWTAANADYQDVHLHGTDGSAIGQALVDLREMLSAYPGGNDVEFVSWEWSPARFGNRDDDAAVRAAILGLWQAMAEGGIKRAAYGSYWATAARRESGISDIYLWKSIMDEDGLPREPIYSTLQDIGMGRVTVYEPDPDDGGDDEGDAGDEGDADSGREYITGGPALWINGYGKDELETMQYLGAAGVRDRVDLRTATARELKAAVKACAKTELGVVLATRWSDPTDADHYDAMPDVRLANQVTSRLRSALKCKDARTVGEGELWVQFFAEVAGEVGRIREADAVALFDYASGMVDIVRSTAGHTKVCGPTLTNLELLNKSTRSADEEVRFAMLERAIDWSIRYADAIDFRLDTVSAANAVVQLQELRTFIDAKPGGTELDLVCWDWNAGLDGSTASSMIESMSGLVVAMSGADVLHAAYGPLSPDGDNDAANNAWALVDNAGNERAAYADAFVELARMVGQYARVPAENAGARKKRENAFKNAYRVQLRDEYRASGASDWKKLSNQAYKDGWEAAWEDHEAERLASYQ